MPTVRDVSPKVPPVWVKDPLVVTAPREISVPLVSEADAVDPVMDSDCTVSDAFARPKVPPEAIVNVFAEPLPPVIEKRPLGRTLTFPSDAVPSVMSSAAKALKFAEPDPIVVPDPVRRTPPESVIVPVTPVLPLEAINNGPDVDNVPPLSR